ncbi:SDR family NAD(P)-dependent oxidoreductase [Streptomyces sp. NPDC059766]|uniref:SDR family NAD(P)-dependent oxidoreductase n=1 Tax=Streptomyces sp. NPDC059766 TaxID=3346940 RepID=UPI0036673D19
MTSPDAFELAGRTAVVTGGASGIGAACVERLRGLGVTAVAWDLAPGADVVCDVSDAAWVAAATERTTATWGTPTLLVGAAGAVARAEILKTSAQEWDRVFAVNARGAFLTLQAVARAATEAGEQGSAVLVSSVNSLVADPLMATYSASKAAVNHLVRVAARELGEHGFRVNAVGPGPTDTPMFRTGQTDEAWLDAIRASTPLGAVGRPADIADAVVHLMQAAWITGQVVMADGGSSLSTARGSLRRAGTTPDAG